MTLNAYDIVSSAKAVQLTEAFIDANQDKEFLLKMGVFGNEPRIVEMSPAFAQLRTHLCVDYQFEMSDSDLLDVFATVCRARIEYENEYARRIDVLSNGVMSISSTEDYIPVTMPQKFPEFKAI